MPRVDRRRALLQTGLSGTTQWAAVAAVMSAGIVSAAQIGKSAAALPVLQADFRLSPSVAAWFVSVMSLLGAFAGAGIGWIGQAWGFRRQIQAGLFAILLMNITAAAVYSTALLMATRVGEGLGFTLVILAAPGVLATISAPRHRRFVVGLWGAYMPLGAGLATLLVPSLIALLGWRGTWYITAFMALGALAAVTRRIPAGPARTAPRIGALRHAMGSSGVWCLAAVFMLFAGQYLAVLGLLPSMLVREGSMPLASAGFVAGIAFLANAPGNLVGAMLQQKGFSRAWLLTGGSLCMALTVWGLYSPGAPVGLQIACAITFSFTAGLVPSATFGGITAMTAGTNSVGVSVGLLIQGASLGQLLVPPLVVAVTKASASWLAAPTALSLLAVLAAFGGVIYRRLEIPIAS